MGNGLRLRLGLFIAFGGSTGWAFSAVSRPREGLGRWKRVRSFTFYLYRIEGEGPILTFRLVLAVFLTVCAMALSVDRNHLFQFF